MLTTQSRRPSTSKRAAVPGFTSATAQTRTSDTGPRDRVSVLDLLDHTAAQGGDERGDREPVEDVVEEAEHDEALRLFGGHATGRQVVELVVVDRAHGAGVRALHVVGFDLDVW